MQDPSFLSVWDRRRAWDSGTVCETRRDTPMLPRAAAEAGSKRWRKEARERSQGARGDSPVFAVDLCSLLFGRVMHEKTLRWTHMFSKH